MPILVPNKFPVLPHAAYRLAVVGEAPGQDEEIVKEPFVGSSGKLLRGTLGKYGLSGDQCFIGNVCQVRPPGNDIDEFSWDSNEIQSGLTQLHADIDSYKPNCILLLGKTALRAFRPDLCYLNERSKLIIPLDNWRGSITNSSTGYKTVPTYHPAYILRVWKDNPYFNFDVARAVRQSTSPGIDTLVRKGILRPTFSEAVEYINHLRGAKQPVTIDIEGYPDNIGVTMISLCPTPYEGMVIPFWLGHHYWSEDEEAHIWLALSALLADPDVPKKAHNCFYELFVLAWRHKVRIVNITEDTMMKVWETQPELEKSLAVTASFHTNEPYYKDERHSNNYEVKLNYNFKDSAVTEECDRSLESTLLKYPQSYAHYRFNISIVPAIHYLNIRGCKLDRDKLEQHLVNTQRDLGVLQDKLNQSVGWEINVKSNGDNGDKAKLIYDQLKFKPSSRYGRCCDAETVLDFFVKSGNPVLKLLFQTVKKRTRVSDIEKLVPDADGRIRTSLDLVGTNTGRLSSRSAIAMYHYFTKTGILKWENSGTNLQNQTKELRDCFVPDSLEYDFWQFDLAGADGWTVGADLAALGAETMLKDYLAGIKPAKVLMLLLAEHEAGRNPANLNSLSRDELARLTKQLVIPEGRDDQGRPADWKYMVCKKVQHGTNYDARPDTIAALVFKDSEGLVELTPAQAAVYQYLYKLRYNPGLRNQWIERVLRDKGSLQSASGIRRKFFSIRSSKIDSDIIREASAFEPQANTTYATNRALRNLWLDPDNRTSRSNLFIEPLLQIHDALAGQYHQAHRDWAHDKLKSYFNNEMIIHGIPITIPADGGWGTDWKNTTNKIK
jgi:uracil-DNA glycosylase family 4